MTFNTLKMTATAALIALAGANAALSETGTEIDLTYVWTAHPGMEEQLVATYDAVGDILEANEPGLLLYEISVSETGNQIIIREIFEDGEALGFHLSHTEDDDPEERLKSVSGISLSSDEDKELETVQKAE